MSTVELTRYALRNAFEVLGQVTAQLTQEQADWTPPGIANPIGALYWHTISSTDEIVCRWALKQEPLHRRAGWSAQALAVAVPEPEGAEGWLEYMRALRVNLPALQAYTQAVAADLDVWLASLSPEDMEGKVATPIGEYTLAQMLETFVIWHINAHCGEISALKGCQGARGYPF